MPSSPNPGSLPCGPLEAVCGFQYFPRMLGKIRLHAQGNLWEQLHENLGIGMDRWCAEFLHVPYEALKTRVLEGGTDEDIFHWCQEQGRELNETDKFVWAQFATKLGWNDRVTPILIKRKRESGLEDRDDIVTMPHFIDVDEGRKE